MLNDQGVEPFTPLISWPIFTRKRPAVLTCFVPRLSLRNAMSKLLLIAKGFSFEAFHQLLHTWRADLPPNARAAIITTASAEWKERNRNATRPTTRLNAWVSKT